MKTCALCGAKKRKSGPFCSVCAINYAPSCKLRFVGREKRREQWRIEAEKYLRSLEAGDIVRGSREYSYCLWLVSQLTK